jgi:aminoglycoside phosphotransferase (APT) family kinase protein
VTINDNGWDSKAWLDGNWLNREPRREQVRPRLLAEATLLPWLAPQLPLPVPVPELTQYGVRHRLLVGEPLEAGSTALGHQLGDHLLVSDGRITGIIDWTDAQIGDPALDLCWLLNGAPEGIATGLQETYRVTDELRQRALDWIRLSPWYQVHRGLLLDLPDDVQSGLLEIVSCF